MLREVKWIKDFKNSVTCPSCLQQFNWDNYDEEQEVFIAKNKHCPFCQALNVIDYEQLNDQK